MKKEAKKRMKTDRETKSVYVPEKATSTTGNGVKKGIWTHIERRKDRRGHKTGSLA